MKRLLALVAFVAIVFCTGCPLATVHQKVLELAEIGEAGYLLLKDEYLAAKDRYLELRNMVQERCGALVLDGETALSQGTCDRLAKLHQRFVSVDALADRAHARAVELGEAKDRALVAMLAAEKALAEADSTGP